MPSALAVTRALIAGKLSVPLPVVADKPNIVAADAAHVDTLLARYVTVYNAGKEDRTHNLTLAAKTIDGVILKPGDEFSVNDAVGPRLEDRGFREAPIFIKGKLEPGLGGGVCQVSSTLYNAVLLAGLKVLAGSHHSAKSAIRAGWTRCDSRFRTSGILSSEITARKPLGSSPRSAEDG